MRPCGSRDLGGRCVRAPLPSARAVGLAIRRARREAGVSVSELAAACRVTPRLVLLWETGGVRLLVARLQQIARALSVPVEHLLCDYRRG